MKIRIKTKGMDLKAELNSSETAKGIYNKLPIKGKINRWGDEIYFEVPVHLDLDEDFAYVGNRKAISEHAQKPLVFDIFWQNSCFKR